MTKTANINIRIAPEKKAQVENLFSSFGISVTDAINIFLNTSLLEGGFPFQIKHPRYSRETELAMEEARLILQEKIKAKKYNSVKELFDDLDTEE